MDSQTIVGLTDTILEPQYAVNVSTIPIAVSTSQSSDTVQVETPSFVLSSGGMYSGNGLVGQVPSWILDAIKTELTTGAGNIQSVIDGLKAAVDALPIGVAQSIASLNTDVLSQSSLLTGLRSDVDNNNASIINTLATKVTPVEAQAISESAITSKFGTDVHAFVGNIASTYVDANSAIAQEINLMQSGISNNTASISTINNTLVTLDTAIASSITTTSASIAATEARIISSYTVYVDANLSYDVNIYSSNGSIFKNGIISTILSAQILKGKTDITADLAPALFSWQRISNSPAADTIWNTAHSGIGNSVTITSSDVYGKATFRCIVNI